MAHSKGDRKGIAGHAAFNTDVFFQLDPDLFLPYAIDDSGEYFFPADDPYARRGYNDIFRDPRFVARWAPATFQGSGLPSCYTSFFAYGKRDLLAEKLQDGLDLQIVE